MIVADVVCPFCGCLCDDLELETDGDRIVAVRNGCALAEATFIQDERLQAPVRRTARGWEETGYEEAVRETAEILAGADRPLLYGWSSTHGESQSIGVHIAERIGAVIDNTSTVCHGPSILAIQEVGHPGCTLGQVKNRADVIIYWGCNPVEAHPRHMSRYTTYATGFFVPEAQKDRMVIVVDTRRTGTAQIADEFVQVEPGGDYAVLSALRLLVREPSATLPARVAGVSREQLARIIGICKDAKFGAIFFGLGLTMSRGKYKNVRNAIELTDELNRHTKFVISPLRGHGNVYGSNEVFTWMSGYPFAVDFSRGIAFYNPGETTAVDVLRRGECDAALIVASDPGANFPRAAAAHLARIPTVVIDPRVTATTALARLHIPCTVAGIDAAGTAYRMDGVPIRLKKVIDRGYPDDAVILQQVYDILNGGTGP